MLIPKNRREEIQKAIADGTLGKLLTPLGGRSLNAPTSQLILPSSPLGKIVPLTDSNGDRFVGTAMECVAEAIRQKKFPANNNEYDQILNGPGELYRQYEWYNWVLTHFSYGKPGEKLGSEILYADSHDNNRLYLVKVPKVFQDYINHALYLEQGFIQPSVPYLTYAPDTFNKKPVILVQFNNEDALIGQNLLKAVPIHRQDGYYLVDAHGIPNGDASAEGIAAARKFWQVDDGTRTYAGLLWRRVDLRRNVYAIRRPSVRAGVLVHE